MLVRLVKKKILRVSQAYERNKKLLGVSHACEKELLSQSGLWEELLRVSQASERNYQSELLERTVKSR